MAKQQKLKHAKTIDHICDKLYVNKKGELIGVASFGKTRRLKSVYHYSFKKAFWKLFFRLLKWALIIAIATIISIFAINLSPVISLAIMIVTLGVAITSIVCYILSFKGEVIENIPFLQIAPKVNEIVDSVKVSDYSEVNMKNYKKLDELSLVYDSTNVRNKKIEILQSLIEDSNYDWEFECDTVLSDRTVTDPYLRKIAAIDSNNIGPAAITQYHFGG